PFEPQIVISRVKELLARPNGASEAAVSAPELATALAAFAPEMSGGAPAVAAMSAAQAEAAAKLDEYFDQLDSAFARFTQGGLRPAALGPAPADSKPPDLDWFGPRPDAVTPAFDPSLSLAPATLPSGLLIPDSTELVREIHALAP